MLENSIKRNFGEVPIGSFINQGIILGSKPYITNYELNAFSKCILGKIRKIDFENALKELEHTKIELLTDYLLTLPLFGSWTRNRVRRLFQYLKLI